jgi:hypothetical protein
MNKTKSAGEDVFWDVRQCRLVTVTSLHCYQSTLRNNSEDMNLH